MLSSIDSASLTPDFNVTSMRRALLDDLDNAPPNDVEMEDVVPSSISANANDMPDAPMLEDEIMDIEMEDASAVFHQPPENDGTPMKKLLKATKDTLFSPTNMGAETALGLSSPKPSPRKPLVQTSSKSVGTSPPQTPVKKAASSALSLSSPIKTSSETHTSLGAPAAPSGPVTHNHHYQVNLPPPWNVPTHVTEDTTIQTNNRLYALSSYLQILSNTAFAAFVGYILLRFVEILSSDINAKKAKYISLAVANSERCAREYVRNECGLDQRAPMLEEMCNKWEACMDADPDHAFGSLRIYAEVIAETINTFIETFAARSLVVGLILVALVLAIIYFSNFAFGYWRAKLYYKDKSFTQNTLKLQ